MHSPDVLIFLDPYRSNVTRICEIPVYYFDSVTRSEQALPATGAPHRAMDVADNRRLSICMHLFRCRQVDTSADISADHSRDLHEAFCNFGEHPIWNQLTLRSVTDPLTELLSVGCVNRSAHFT